MLMMPDPPPASSSRPSLLVDPNEVNSRMDSIEVRIVLEMGYSADLIREMIQKRLATSGSDHETSEQLLDDVFKAHDEKQKANSTQNTDIENTAQGVSRNDTYELLLLLESVSPSRSCCTKQLCICYLACYLDDEPAASHWKTSHVVDHHNVLETRKRLIGVRQSLPNLELFVARGSRQLPIGANDYETCRWDRAIRNKKQKASSAGNRDVSREYPSEVNDFRGKLHLSSDGTARRSDTSRRCNRQRTTEQNATRWQRDLLAGAQNELRKWPGRQGLHRERGTTCITVYLCLLGRSGQGTLGLPQVPRSSRQLRRRHLLQLLVRCFHADQPPPIERASDWRRLVAALPYGFWAIDGIPAKVWCDRPMSFKLVLPQDSDVPAENAIDTPATLKLVVPYDSHVETVPVKHLRELPTISPCDATAVAAYKGCKASATLRLGYESLSTRECLRLVEGYWPRPNNQLCTNVVCTGAVLFGASVQRSLGSRLQWLAQLAIGQCQTAFSLELLRLASFADWPHLGKLSALRCSSAGFHRKTAVGTTSRGDDVACFCCGCTVEKWTAGVHPMTLHRDKCSQHCRFVAEPTNSGNIPISKDPIQLPISESVREVLAVPSSVASATASSAEIPSAADCMSSLGVKPLKPLVALALGSYSEAGLAAIASGSSLVKDLIATSRRTGVQSAAGSASASRDDELTKHESYRLDTFSSVWTYDHIVDARELARNGFFYAGPGDRVQCAFCQGLLRNWEPGDRVEEQHAQHFTYCRFVQGHDVGNVPIPFWSLAAKQTAHVNAMDTADASRDDLGITSTPPKNPEFAIEARRLSTFATWPTTHHLQPDMLAKAGFFYLGKEDAARCFFCDGTVADWKTNVDPWIEHAQRFPSCSFVLQVKGHDFVQRHRLQDPPPASSSRPSLAVDPREVRARMDASKVRILLQMDYPLDLIREVVQKRLATVGSDHDTSEQLLDDVFQTHDEKQKANSTQSAGRRAAPDSAGPVVISRPQVRGTDEPRVLSLPIGGASSPQLVAMAASAPAALKADGSLTVHNLSGGAEKLPPLVSLPAVAQPPEEENRQLKTQLTCKVCMDSLVGIVFLPCGHLVCCASCAPAMTTCPICRVSIRGTVRTIL